MDTVLNISVCFLSQWVDCVVLAYFLFFTTSNWFFLRIKRPKKSTILKEYEDWNYDLAAPDWINEDLGLRLAKYKVPDELEELLAFRVNKDFE